MSIGEGNGTPLQYSCLENPMDGGAWYAAVHGVAESWTQVSNFTFTFHFRALEKKMATHSSVLAWRIPGTGETGGLLSMGSHRVGHDRSNLAAAYVYQHPFLPTWGPGQAGGDGGHSMDIVGDRPHRSQGSPALTRPLIRCLAPWSPCLIDRVPDELWTEVRDIVQETRIKTIPMEKKCKRAKWLSEEALQIAVKRKKAKSKEENERYSHFNAEFQRIARKDK